MIASLICIKKKEKDPAHLRFYFRGVLQTLVEKHFPASDRNHIHRILGIEPSKMQRLEDLDDFDGAGGSSGGTKRKPIRQAAQRASKRVRTFHSDDDFTDDERNGARSSGSEYKQSGSESEDDQKSDEESNITSDSSFNYSESDSGRLHKFIHSVPYNYHFIVCFVNHTFTIYLSFFK